MLAVFAQFADHVGVVGVLLTLIAYYLLSVGRLAAESLSYGLLNFFGSWLILFSLMFSWNLSSVLIESAWILISVVCIYRARRAANR